MKHPFILSLCLLLTLLSCKTPVDNHLQEAERLLNNEPDSALMILRALEPGYRNMPEEEKALFGLLYFQACDKENIELYSTEMIDYSIDYYKHKNQRYNLANSLLYKGRHFKEKRNYAEAIHNALKAIELANPRKDHNLLGKAYSELAQVSIYQEESEKALTYVQQSITHFDKASDSENVAKMHMVASWAYQQLDRSDEAIRSSLKAFELTNDSIVMGDVLNDIGMIYSHQEVYDSTLHYSKQSLPYPYYSTNQSMRYYQVALSYFHLDKNDSALIYAFKAFEYPIDIYIEGETYRLLANTYYDNGDQENFNTYLLKYHATQDSIHILEKQPNINLLEEIHNTNIEKERIKSQRALLIVMVAFVLLSSAILFILLRRRNNRKETEVITYKNELSRKHELQLEELMSEIEHIKQKHATRRRQAKFEERTEIDKQVYVESLHIDNEQMFVDKMNRKLNSLPDKLHKQYPGISFKEILWCCLFVLKVPTTEISMLLDYTQNSQYKFKQRLVKKLNLNSTRELEQMLTDCVLPIKG